MYQQFAPFIIEEYFIAWMYQNWLIHSPVAKHLGCLQFGAITNKIIMNIYV